MQPRTDYFFLLLMSISIHSCVSISMTTTTGTPLSMRSQLQLASRCNNNYYREPFKTRLRTAIANSGTEDTEEFDRPKVVFQEDADKPFIAVRDLDQERRDAEIARRRQASAEAAERDRLSTFANPGLSSGSGNLPGSGDLKKVKVFGSLTAEELIQKRIELRPSSANRGKVPAKIEDLNGVNPLKPLFFSIVPAGMAVAGWLLSAYLTDHFAVTLLDSDVYAVKRFAIVTRNLVVGIATLGTAFCAAVSVGLLLLAGRVAIGVARGELDPNLDVSSTSGNAEADATNNSNSKERWVGGGMRDSRGLRKDSLSGLLSAWMDKQNEQPRS